MRTDQLYHYLLFIRVIHITFKILSLMNLIILHSARSSHAQKTVRVMILLVLTGFDRFLIERQKRKSLYEIDDYSLWTGIIVMLIYRLLSTRIQIASFLQSSRRILRIDYSLLILDYSHHSLRSTHKELIDYYQRVKVLHELLNETSGLSFTRLGRRHSI